MILDTAGYSGSMGPAFAWVDVWFWPCFGFLRVGEREGVVFWMAFAQLMWWCRALCFELPRFSLDGCSWFIGKWVASFQSLLSRGEPSVRV